MDIMKMPGVRCVALNVVWRPPLSVGLAATQHNQPPEEA